MNENGNALASEASGRWPAWKSWNILAPSSPEESSLVPMHKGWTQGRRQDLNANGPGRLQAVTLHSGETNLLLGLAPIGGWGAPAPLSRHRIPHRRLPAERRPTRPPAPIMEGNLEPGESICHRQHKPLNSRANLDQQVLQECTNHLLFLSFFLSKLCLLC